MRKGFYDYFDEALIEGNGWKDFEIENYLDMGEMDFLRFLKINLEDYHPYTFLHDYSYAFAATLNLKYGYEMKGIYDENDKLICAYCIAHRNGCGIIFIDLRGCTDNWDEFIEEYRQYLPYKESIPYPIPDTDSMIADDFRYEDKTPFIVAKSIIDFNEKLYNAFKN